MQRCEYCQDECVDLVPVVNRDVMSSTDFAWVCVGCAEMVRDEYAADLFRSPVDFTSFRVGSLYANSVGHFGTSHRVSAESLVAA